MSNLDDTALQILRTDRKYETICGLLTSEICFQYFSALLLLSKYSIFYLITSIVLYCLLIISKL